ncbi:MAG TPA: glycoside hydrolase family 3 N-terminal domain-containing protein [Gaiellaceae bacterium]|nr:glycoside hydrolase family 3 N-terminal domain-containing protein [Gaiellaceae bacterium]
MSRRGAAAGAVVALIAAATACVGAGTTAATTTKPATHTHRRTSGIADTAEVVMGTLTAPPSSSFLARVREGGMGGVLFLGNGWLTQSNVKAMTSKLQKAACVAGEPLLIAVDQEGGIVKRLSWAPPTEAPADMQSPTDAHAQAAAAASALRTAGIDVDFAPVVDTPSSASNFLGTRAFSRSRTWNAAMARAFVGGLQRNGVAATAKHFPGLGLAGGNTDNGQIEIDSAAWKIKEGLLPFQAAVNAGVKLVMISTAIYPHLDPSRKPAAFSAKIIQGILRKQLGFKGVTVTDSLTAPAPDAIPHAATKAMLAGSDLLIWGSESAAEAGYLTLAQDAATSKRLQARLAQAAGRIRALKAWLTAQGGPSCS